MTIFHNPADYAAASAPHDPLWRKDPKDYTSEDKARHANHPQLRDEVLKRLHERYNDFYKRADQIYDTLKQLDADFENDPAFEEEHKAKILSYLAIRGTRDWDLEFLRNFRP